MIRRLFEGGLEDELIAASPREDQATFEIDATEFETAQKDEKWRMFCLAADEYVTRRATSGTELSRAVSDPAPARPA
jgi:hypothetical protein